MSQNALRLVLQSLDQRPSTLFGSEGTRRWPKGEATRLMRVGLLRAASCAETAECDGCHRACIERVEFANDGEGTAPRAYVVCSERDDVGRVRVDLGRLQQWEASGQLLADTVAGPLGSAGGVEQVVRGSLWGLGALQHGGRRMDLFLACGAAASDAPTTFAGATRVSECSTAVVLVPWTIPERSSFPGGPVTLSVGRLLTLERGKLRLDVGEVVTAYGKQRPKRVQRLVPFPTPPGTTWEQVLIEFANDEYVKVIAGNVEDHKSLAEMGFADRRKASGKPDRLWELLVALAEREGRASFGDSGSQLTAPSDDTKRRFSDLRQRLRAYFGIHDDPLEPYARVNSYQTKFVLRWSDTYRRSRTR